MYLLFADESGTHGSSHAFVLGGLAVHEQDMQALQRALNRCVEDGLGIAQVGDHELHATEIRNAKKPREGGKTQIPSPWAFVPRASRLRIFDSAYSILASFGPANPQLPVSLFGVVLDRKFHSEWSVFERERFAYEVMLNKFDVMLKRVRTRDSLDNRGLVIHDRRSVAERDTRTGRGIGRRLRARWGSSGILPTSLCSLTPAHRASCRPPIWFPMRSIATMIQTASATIMPRRSGTDLTQRMACFMDAFTTRRRSYSEAANAGPAVIAG